jgi:tyrosyl-tRNA synthetase
MEAKKRLAHEIVSRYHGDDAAAQAAAHFTRVHQQGDLPAEIPVYCTPHEAIGIVDLLVDAGLAPSKSQARRLIAQRGVRLDGDTVEDVATTVSVGDGLVVQVGRRRCVRLARDGERTDIEGMLVCLERKRVGWLVAGWARR